MSPEERKLLLETAFGLSQQLKQEGYLKSADRMATMIRDVMNPPSRPPLKRSFSARVLAVFGLVALAGCGGGNYASYDNEEPPTYRQQALFGLGSSLLLQANQRPAYMPMSTPTRCVSRRGFGGSVMTDCQ